MEILKKKYKTSTSKYWNAIKKSEANLQEDARKQYTYDKVGELMICDPNDAITVCESDTFMYKAYNDKVDIEIDRYINPPEIKEGAFKCKKCGSEKTYFYQMQKRSADEPMTTFITCANASCKNKWTE